MNISRRKAISLIGAVPSSFALQRALGQKTVSSNGAGDGSQKFDLSITPGPFKGTRESLRQWEIPDWYRDAKFGIWAHWGPQSGIEAGDWFARNMYVQGSKQYEYHVKTYRHPTKVGYKDVIPTWKAEKFDPDHLLGLYKKAGAKYFCSMAVHHDNFDVWNSK